MSEFPGQSMGDPSEAKISAKTTGDMITYQDPSFGFSLKYPSGWLAIPDAGGAGFYRAQEVDMKFRDPTASFPDGVMIGVTAIHSSNQDTARKIVEEMIKKGFIVTKPETLFVGGKPGIRVEHLMPETDDM